MWEKLSFGEYSLRMLVVSRYGFGTVPLVLLPRAAVSSENTPVQQKKWTSVGT